MKRYGSGCGIQLIHNHRVDTFVLILAGGVL